MKLETILDKQTNTDKPAPIPLDYLYTYLKISVIWNKNEQKLIIDESENKTPVAIVLSMLAIISIFVTVTTHSSFTLTPDSLLLILDFILFLCLSIGISIPALYHIAHAIIKPKKIFVFDRLNQNITYPISWSKNRTVHLISAKPELAKKGGFYKIIFHSTDFHTYGFGAFKRLDKTLELWTSLMQFMDTKSDLPPGRLLDPYRTGN